MIYSLAHGCIISKMKDLLLFPCLEHNFVGLWLQSTALHKRVAGCPHITSRLISDTVSLATL